MTPTSHPLLRDLSHSLPMALLRTREAVLGRFRAVLAEYDLTEQQWRVLRALDEQDGLEISLLAETCWISPPSMSGILKRLEARELVARTANAADGRSTLIGLTRGSKALIRQIKPRVLGVYADIGRVLGEEGLERLYALLEALEAGLGKGIPKAG